MFSSEDIRRLLDTFPPSSPLESGKDITFVRSFPGTHLVRSDVVRTTFRRMLETESMPIILKNLPSSIGVQNSDWLLSDDSLDLIYSKDGQGLIPTPLQNNILDEFYRAVSSGFVDELQYATSNGISAESLRKLSNRPDTHATAVSINCNGQVYRVSERVLEGTKQSVKEVMSQASGDLNDTDIAISHGTIPPKVLAFLAEQILASHKDNMEGRIVLDQDRVVFSQEPAKTESCLQENSIKEAEKVLDLQGFCDLRELAMSRGMKDVPAGLAGRILESYQANHTENIEVVQSDTDEALTKTQMSGAVLLVCRSTLSKRQSALQEATSRVAAELWSQREPSQDITFDAAARGKLANDSHTYSLDVAVLQSPHCLPIVTAFKDSIQTLQHQASTALILTLQRQILAPLKLYTTGLESLTDPTLREHVNDFIFDHFRREAIPDTLASLRAERLVSSKAALTDLDRFARGVHDATGVEDIHAAVRKFLVRRLKVEQPDAAVLAATKAETLRLKVKAMGKMKRASDLLQNLTWILLASVPMEEGGAGTAMSAGEALFMSSGKDTSRMVRLYKERVAGLGESARLEELRDLIKQGKDTEEHRIKMRRMAQAALPTG